jgi:hypothetical protein
MKRSGNVVHKLWVEDTTGEVKQPVEVVLQGDIGMAEGHFPQVAGFVMQCRNENLFQLSQAVKTVTLPDGSELRYNKVFGKESVGIISPVKGAKRKKTKIERGVRLLLTYDLFPQTYALRWSTPDVMYAPTGYLINSHLDWNSPRWVKVTDKPFTPEFKAEILRKDLQIFELEKIADYDYDYLIDQITASDDTASNGYDGWVPGHVYAPNIYDIMDEVAYGPNLVDAWVAPGTLNVFAYRDNATGKFNALPDGPRIPGNDLSSELLYDYSVWKLLYIDQSLKCLGSWSLYRQDYDYQETRTIVKQIIAYDTGTVLVEKTNVATTHWLKYATYPPTKIWGTIEYVINGPFLDLCGGCIVSGNKNYADDSFYCILYQSIEEYSTRVDSYPTNPWYYVDRVEGTETFTQITTLCVNCSGDIFELDSFDSATNSSWDLWMVSARIYDAFGIPLYVFSWHFYKGSLEDSVIKYGCVYKGELTVSDEFPSIVSSGWLFQHNVLNSIEKYDRYGYGYARGCYVLEENEKES